MMNQFFPQCEVFINLEPEEAGQYLLMYLNNFVRNNRNQQLHKSHFINSSNSDVINYSGQDKEKVLRVMAEAWQWLEKEGFLAPVPDAGSEGWMIISRRGEKVQAPGDFKNFKHIQMLPKKNLDPILAQKVWPSFVSGDFDTAIFAAFKEVEIRMRDAAELDNTHYGTKLAREVFHIEEGQLTDKTSVDRGERQAYSDLFAGAIGVFKSPGDHRVVNYDDPFTAVSIIMFANTLIQIIEKRKNLN